MCGIYMIRCRTNGKYYIGGTTYPFEERFAAHRSMLSQNKAPRMLQACFDLYGLDNLEFIPLKEFPPEEVADREREALDQLKPELNIYGTGRVRLPVTPRVGKTIEFNGELLTIPELAERHKLKPATVYERLRRGLSIQDAVKSRHKAPRKAYARFK